ncbi:hypothetical protein SH139x_001050 [Planctomycetaceae bacterium SH139]
MPFNTSHDRLNNPLSFLKISNTDRRYPRLLGREIVPARENRVADEEHVGDHNTQCVAELSSPKRFRYSGLCDNNRRGATEVDRELGNQVIKDRLNLLSFRKVRIPLLLLFNGSLTFGNIL